MSDTVRVVEQQPHFFDTFTGREAERMETVMVELDRVPWAQRVLHEVQQNGGLIGKNMARFFELRFGHALHKAGIAVEYEVPGEGNSTLDFGFTSRGQPWKVEMMRLQETQAAKAATTTEVDNNGTRWIKRILSSNNEDKTQSTEGETLKAIERICQKCELGGKPHKFSKPDKALHAILVDMRTFKDGGDVHDRVHIGLGGEYVELPYRTYYWGQSKSWKQISGVFGPRTELKGAAEARERVHFIGFLRERSFQPSEFGEVIQFVANPHLFKDAAAVKAASDTWPFQPAHIVTGRTPAMIEPDGTWPRMWRVKLPGGHYSDMVNLTRAKDAARHLPFLNRTTRETPPPLSENNDVLRPEARRSHHVMPTEMNEFEKWLTAPFFVKVDPCVDAFGERESSKGALAAHRRCRRCRAH